MRARGFSRNTCSSPLPTSKRCVAAGVSTLSVIYFGEASRDFPRYPSVGIFTSPLFN